MPFIKRAILFVLLCLTVLLASCMRDVPRNEPPNILLIVADDLGYADVGVFGGEIPTPNIDSLANNGMLLTNFYSSLACSPTRSMLLSGTDNHLAGLGVMGTPSRDDQKNQPGYEGYLNFRVASMANLLTDAGYNTYMTGKWHLGRTWEKGPKSRGFKKSFVSIDGAAHLGGLSWNGPGLAPYRDGNEMVTVGDDFYSTRFYTDRMIQYIEEDRQDNKPFFAYLAYTAPHWPVQAPEESIAKFKGKYDQGYEVLHRQRLEQQKKLGLTNKDVTPLADDVWEKRWSELTDEQKKIESRKMEVYAAMVSDLDFYIGKVIDYLKSINEFDNTFILFISDNGAEGTRREIVAPLSDWVEKCCDNSYENLGKGDSYIMYGPDWARASATPFNGRKATAFEGGIHVPAFVHYKGLVTPGSRSNGFGTVMDVLPTFLALAGTGHPGTHYRGNEILPMKGKSLVPLLSGETEEVHPEDGYTGWELYGHRSIRHGDWKIVWDPRDEDDAKWRLYNLTDDLEERNDLAAENPGKLAEMLTLWDTYVKESGVIY